MSDKTEILLALKKRLALGEISEAEYDRLSIKIMAEESVSGGGSGSFDARATFQGHGVGSLVRDRYEILSQLGRGGMGVVYKARDRELDTIVAIKVLNEELARDERAIRDLIEEAKITMRLTHPHIMRLINFESDERRKFLVMEYIDGETLEKKLGREGKIAEPDLVKLAADICEGLGYAHKKNVIHRDIKPSNIMLTAEGEVKITDFGIARVMKDSMTMVTGRQTTGTLIYMSPEQIDGQNVDARSDLYSMGIMLYELASGRPPFYQGDITNQQLRIAPKPLAGLSPRFNGIILRCLEKDRTKRYSSADELKSVLLGKEETASEIASKAACEKAEREAVARECAARESADRERARHVEAQRRQEESVRPEAESQPGTILFDTQQSPDSKRVPKAALRVILSAVVVLVAVFVFWPARPSKISEQPVPAQSKPDKSEDNRVSDYGGILNNEERSKLSSLLSDLERLTTVQMVIVISSPIAGQSIESYSHALFMGMRPGYKEVNNGILIVVAPNERKIRIELGIGIGWIISESDAGSIIKKMSLEFREGNYYKGLLIGCKDIIMRLRKIEWGVRYLSLNELDGNRDNCIGRIVAFNAVLSEEFGDYITVSAKNNPKIKIEISKNMNSEIFTLKNERERARIFARVKKTNPYIFQLLGVLSSKDN